MKLDLNYGMGYFHPKLGDTLVYMSGFCHFDSVVWRQKFKSKPNGPWLEAMPMYRGRYDLKVKYKGFVGGKNCMYEFAKMGVKMARPDFTPVEVEGLPEKYITVQGNTGFAGRDRDVNDLTKYAEGLPIVNLDDLTQERDGKSIARLMTVQQGAEFHVGPDSGCVWSAISVGTPVKVIGADRTKLSEKRWMMHHCALALMNNNENVEIIPYEQ